MSFGQPAVEHHVAALAVPVVSKHDAAATPRALRAHIAASLCSVRADHLSPYSPDFSPIELAFAKLKEARRRVGARTRETLIDAIAATLDTITTIEARAFFTHCGYRLAPDWDHLLSTLL